MQRALISVSDKNGIIELARALAALDIQLLSTGGTAKLLRDAGLEVTEVAEITGFPEMLDGRVKTLHPVIHGGLLARRELSEHMQALTGHGIGTIDLLIVNLYPFAATVARPGCTLEDAIENIDIGGPAMVRSAAKNWRGVGVLTDPAQYGPVLEELRASGSLSDQTRFRLAVAAFDRIADYDVMISEYLGSLTLTDDLQIAERAEFGPRAYGRFEKVMDLRYGENPHQQAAFYRDLQPAPGSIVTGESLQGKPLSYNNIADGDAAWECVKSLPECACVIVKHANPCGVALAATPLAAYQQAFATDPTSAFGGIIAFNRPVDGETATAVSKQFVEVLMAPAFDDAALKVFADKPNVRLLRIALDGIDTNGDDAWSRGLNSHDTKRVGSGILIQTADIQRLDPQALRVVTRRRPTDTEMADLLFAWRVAKFVKSNAIVFCGHGRTLGVGAGQMSRIDSARIASIKADNAGLSLAGSVAASDAFFPFRDGLDVLVQAGARAVIQPGGSVRDDEVIAAADEQDVAMLFTGMRHFRH
ncbi:MAG: bifunctional phosphoribosylaminoimidazolecarboxamide formyltransferase/IMP cyclohydrolase [Burkholderiaceae bacterium]